jgi:hypothetical protein
MEKSTVYMQSYSNAEFLWAMGAGDNRDLLDNNSK